MKLIKWSFYCILIAILTLITSLAAACGTPPDVPSIKATATGFQVEISLTPPAQTSNPTQPAPTSLPFADSETGSQSPQSTVEVEHKAIKDLAERLGVNVNSIQLIQVIPDEFPAGDLGCPAPGETPLPIPAFVSGQTIILEAGGVQYTYRAHRGTLAFCGPW